MTAEIRTKHEEQMVRLLQRFAVLPAGALLSTVRFTAKDMASWITPESLRERALHVALRWVAAAKNDTPLEQVRKYAAGVLDALDVPEERLAFWTDVSERQLANGTAAKVLTA